MRLRTFTAPDMPAAMHMVREALGEDAIILASEKRNGKAVSVTAAIDLRDDKPVAAPKVQEKRNDVSADNLRYELQNILRFHNLPELYIARLLQRATDSDLISALALHQIGGNHNEQHLFRLALEKLVGLMFSFDPLPLDAPESRIMLVGVPGIGKTMTIAKLAARLTLEKQPVAVITTDNKRAGGVEQLKAFTDILNIELRVAPTREELINALNSLPGKVRVLIDTAGCNPYGDADMEELAGLVTLPDVEPVLVMPAGGDSLEAIDMVESFAPLPIRRLLITRADTARRFGGILAVAAAQGLAFSHISSSASIADTLHPVDAPLLAQLLLKYQL